VINALKSPRRFPRGHRWSARRKMLLLVLAAAAIFVNGIRGDAAFVPLQNNGQDIPPIPLSQIGPNGIVVGDKLFTNFKVVGFGFGGAVAPDLSSFLIQGGQNVDGNPSTPDDWGLRFLTAMNAGNGQTTNANLTFQVSVIPPPQRAPDPGWHIKDVSMQLTGASATGNGVVNISETVYDGPSVLSDNLLASLSVSKQVNGPLADMKDHAEFDPQLAIWVRKDISVTGGQVGAGHLSEFFQFYSQVFIFAPEPTSWAMMSAGGVAVVLGAWLRRRRANPSIQES
jgi:hypothetical protein